ncbi:hypothetical protein ACWEOW_11185 [Monashia sp. NPDC004114]
MQQVYVSNFLPLTPTDAEVARRIVRHGLRDVIEWLGEDVGPRPKDQTHALLVPSRYVEALYVSPWLYARMRHEIA